jgi:hypothetical protein
MTFGRLAVIVREMVLRRDKNKQFLRVLRKLQTAMKTLK